MQFYIDEKTQKIIKKYPHRAIDIAQSFDSKQVACKQWLYDELHKLKIPQEEFGLDDKEERIYIAGSWYGNIIVPLIRKLYDCVIWLHDLDEEALKISNNIYFNDDILTRINLVDCTTFDYRGLVINTSCEHMFPMTRFKKLNRGFSNDVIYVLQSTNEDKYEDHINCVNGPEELAEQAEFVDIMYSGTKKLDNGMDRFMVIGR